MVRFILMQLIFVYCFILSFVAFAMKIDNFLVISDIHLEFRSKTVDLKELIPKYPGADILCVAGDVCPVYDNKALYSRFLLYCSQTWSRTYITTGNHCYYTQNKSKPANMPASNTFITFLNNLIA